MASTSLSHFKGQTRQIFNSVRVKKGVCNGCEPTSKMKARDEPAHSADTTQTSAVSSGSSIYLSQHTAAQQVLSTGADETPSSSCSSDSHRQSSAKPTCDDRITHLQSTTSNAELGELPQPPLASSQRVPELFTAQPGTRRTYSTGSLSEQCGSSPKSTVGVMNFLIPPATVSGVIGKGGGTVKEIVRTTRCRVSVACQTTTQPVVVLIGGLQERLAALREIRYIVYENQRAQHASTSLSMLVPERQLGLVIGKSGSHIADVAARTKAQLSLSRDSYPDTEIPAHVPRDGPQKELTISGEFDAVQSAVDLVLAKLDEYFPAELLASARDVHFNRSSTSAAFGQRVLAAGTPLLAGTTPGGLGGSASVPLYQSSRSGALSCDVCSSATPLLDVLSARQRGNLPTQLGCAKTYSSGSAPYSPGSSPTKGQSPHAAPGTSPSVASTPGPVTPKTLQPLMATPPTRQAFAHQQQQPGFFQLGSQPVLSLTTLQLQQRGHHQPRIEARPNLMVLIPKREVGGFIGKDGAHVRELERLSGARISVESSKGEADIASTVTFRGTIDENVRAYQLTVQLLAELHRASATTTPAPLNDSHHRHISRVGSANSPESA